MYSDCFDDFIDLEDQAQRDRRARLIRVIGAGFVLLSIGIFLLNTRHGIGIWVDSTRYMGLSERPYDAPLYAWMLQSVASFFDIDTVAKLLGLVTVAANSGLIWHVLIRATNHYRYAILGTALVVLSPQFVALHASAMSEPLFLFFMLLTLLAFLRYLETDSRLWLVVCAISLALATLTRFVAPPLGAALAVCIVVNPRQAIGRRIGDATILAVVSASIFLFWLFYSHLTGGRSIGRELWFYGNMGTKEWLTSLEALTAWLLPDAIPFVARVATFAVFAVSIAVLTFVHTRRALRRAHVARVVDDLLPAILGLFFLFYLVFVVLSTSIEANLSLNSRYAFPIYVTTMLMAAIVLARTARAAGKIKLLHDGVVALLIVVAIGHAVRTTVRSEEAFRMGVGYASLAWKNSPTIAAIRTLPADSVLYSNGADAIAYLLRRPASFIPERVQLRTDRENPLNPLDLQLERIRAKTEQTLSHVVIFDKVNWRFYLLDEAELVQRLSLTMIADEPDGRIYAMPGEAEIK
jgi:hypothetical protein